MNAFLLKLISVLLWIWFIVSSVLLTPVILVLFILTVAFDRRRFLLHRLSCFWGAQYIWVNPLWKLRISGREKIDDRRPFILICNHQSLVDILVVYSLFKHFKWTSKTENFRLPFVGWVLSLNRSIRIYRGSKDAYGKFRSRALFELATGSPVMIFPEGTRSRTGEPGPFKDGAFLLAHEAKADILPMVLDGSSKAIPKSGWSLTGKVNIRLNVLDPVPYSEFRDLDIKETNKKFHEIIRRELKILQQTS
jgi:1-acyl-sn-glycerol-3-phosphate acyltransferase